MTRAELLAATRAELATRETHYPKQVDDGRMLCDEAGRGIASWRVIVALLEHGSSEFEACLGDTPQAAWPHLVEAAEKALEHRRSGKDGPQVTALARIRLLIWRSAFRAGADLPCPEPERIAA